MPVQLLEIKLASRSKKKKKKRKKENSRNVSMVISWFLALCSRVKPISCHLIGSSRRMSVGYQNENDCISTINIGSNPSRSKLSIRDDTFERIHYP